MGDQPDRKHGQGGERAKESFHMPESRRELPIAVLAGAGFALLLFVLMALAQLMGEVEPPASEIDETFAAYVPPTIDEVEPPNTTSRWRCSSYAAAWRMRAGGPGTSSSVH